MEKNPKKANNTKSARLSLKPYAVSLAEPKQNGYKGVTFKTIEQGESEDQDDGSLIFPSGTHSNARYHWNAFICPPNEAVEEAVNEDEETNWNELFQSLVDMVALTPFESEWRSKALGTVIDLFTKEALPEARKIIGAELSGEQIAYDRYDIGEAGGNKFVSKNKLFKLIGGDTISSVYSDDFVAAVKVPKNEMAAINYLLSLNKPGLHIPLTAIISYGCYAVVVSALIPINSKTLVYGSADRGNTVKDESEPFRQMMEEIGKTLNLKKHQIGNSGKYLFTAFDVEGHIGTDNRMYLLDVARLFPSLPMESNESSKWLYNLFKPQLVVKLSQPLCSDAFSSLFVQNNIVEATSDQHNIDLAEDHLKNVEIPQLAQHLDNDINISSFEDIKSHFDRHGVNLQFLGLVYERVKTNTTVKYHLLLQMMARAIKYDLLRYLNASGGKIDQYRGNWSDYKKMAKSKYNLEDIEYTLEALAPLNRIVIQDLVLLVEHISGIKLHTDKYPSFKIQSIHERVIKLTPPKPLSIEQLEKLVDSLIAKQSPISLVMEAKIRLAEAYRDDRRLQDALDIFLEVLDYYKKVEEKEGFAVVSLMLSIAEIFIEKLEYDKGLELVQECMRFGLPPFIEHLFMSFMLMHQEKYIEALKYCLQVREYFTQKFGTDNPYALNVLVLEAIIHLELENYEEAEQLFSKLVNIYGSTLGNQHPTTIEISAARQMAQNLQNKSTETALPNLLPDLLGIEHQETLAVNLLDALNKYKKGDIKTSEKEFGKAVQFMKPASEFDMISLYQSLSAALNDEKEAGLGLSKIRKAAKKFSELFGEEHSKTIHTKLLEARIYFSRDEFDVTLEICKKQLEILTKMQRKSLRTFELRFLELMFAVYGLRGQEDLATPLTAKIFALSSELDGMSHPYTVLSQKIMLMTERIKNGRFNDGLNMLQECQALLTNVEDSDPFLPSLTAVTFYQQGKYVEALEELKKNTAFRESNSVNHSVYHALGSIYLELGDDVQAYNSFQKAYELQLRVLGEESHYTVLTLQKIALIDRRQGRCESALERYKQIMELQKKMLGPQHESTIENTLEIVCVLFQLQKFEDALPFCQQVLSSSTQTLGWDHPYRRNAAFATIVISTKQGDYNLALTLCKALLTRKGPEEDSVPIVIAMCNIAEALEKNNLAMALKVYNEALEAAIKTLGMDNEETLRIMLLKARIYREQKEYKMAALIYEQVSDHMARIQGIQHPDTRTVIYASAHLYFLQNEYHSALQLLEKLGERAQIAKEMLEFFEEYFGSDSEETKTARELLEHITSDETEKATDLIGEKDEANES